MEGMWTKLFPAVQKARALIPNSDIGYITFVSSDFGVALFGAIDGPPGRIMDLLLGVYPTWVVSMAFDTTDGLT